jgi:hypothetical protein
MLAMNMSTGELLLDHIPEDDPPQNDLILHYTKKTQNGSYPMELIS